MEEEQRSTPRATLPFAIGIAVLALYIVTLNQWVSVRSLPMVAKVTGWDWTPITAAPLFHLLTWPIRWLPLTVQPLALNVFSAICGALAVGLLARSVQLLPQDRTHDQRIRERSEFSLLTIKFAWVPVVLAAATFALELTMWEHATAATGEALDVLLLAIVIWCLLEYRISLNESWLTRMAFVYGLGVTNNWALIALFPFALAAVIWIKGLGFFNSRFILKMLGAGVAGLLLYFFLPLVWLMQKDASMSFLEVLRSTLANQKMFVADTPPLRVRALVLGLTSLLPVIIMGIRWPTTVGDTSKAGAVLTQFFFRVIHFVFFAACIAMALNLKFSPRELGYGLPFLSFYYLGALALGYYSGYLLLVHREAPKKHVRRDSGAGKALYPLAQGLVWAALIGVPGYLLYKNLPQAFANNGKLLRELVGRAAEKLPKQPVVVLSDDVFHLTAVSAYLATSGNNPGHALVNTRLLPLSGYQERLLRRYPNLWPKPEEDITEGGTYGPITLATQVYSLSRTNKAFYLHPSFGYFFEDNYLIPHGMLYELRPYPQNAIFPPAPSPELIAENQAFWKETEPLIQEAKAKRESADPAYVGMVLSRSLNYWGRELNHNGQKEAALKAFATAADLNTNNVPAALNHEFASAQAGKKIDRSILDSTDLYGRHRTLEMLLLQNGPYDHPQRSFLVGENYFSQGLARQAAATFREVTELDPSHFEARMALAGSYLRLRQPDLVLEMVERLRKESSAQTNMIALASLEASAYVAKGNNAAAEKVLMDQYHADPKDIQALGVLTELYRATQQMDKALTILERQIAVRPENIGLRFQKAELLINAKRYEEARRELDNILQASPNNVTALLQHTLISIYTADYNRALTEVEKALQGQRNNVQRNDAQALTYKGIAYFHLEKYPEALRALDQVLEKNPDDLIALRNRAVTHLRAKNFDKAEEDYRTLMKHMPRSPAVYYGLGEVAHQRNNREEAINHYQTYLKLMGKEPLQGELLKEKELVESRLKELNPK